ncbi:fumarylacetoacetate hydrolase family protein [Nocardioides sp. BP30]|uniref:fumarylacetoacetate hydrolase family protein n=1 Tax=Nocardioides sp. BP30 TaxID=3036374 RepID=UPI00246824E2|nr:fumarylacetoacetate hydrolase family protein [Nocardioides sp. BP30]WGL52180.1 fumarylacetoacetate hydrolase family protein [Nocardioides sp. BP30]
MRLATVSQDGRRFAAVVAAAGTVHEIRGRTLEDLVSGGLPAALEAGRAALAEGGVPLDGVRLELPYRPASVRDFVTFEAHVEGVRRSVDGAVGVPEAWYDAPTFYFTNPHALFGPDEPIRRPATCRRLDFELEVGVVVGRDGSDLAESEAAEAIFGYTIVNDWSARDLQSREMQVGLGPAKGKDFATSIGPWIVTADELAPYVDPRGFLDLDCRVSVNGSQVGRDRLSSMHWTFAQMIAYASRDSLVRAGDLLASGTTGGGGCLAELWGRYGEDAPPPLEPGDEVRIDVEVLGTLAASVTA